MNEGWIKLHRKMLSNDELFKSSHTFTVWCWLLLNADHKTGELKIGRNMLSNKLRIKPSTLYQTLKRLKTMKMIQTQSNNKVTTVTILNWSKYQSNQQEEKTNVNAIQTQSNTIQEYKNKEYINILPEDKPPAVKKVINHPYREIIAYCREKQSLPNEFINYVKQTTAVKKILNASYSMDDIRFVIDEMSSDEYFSCNPFDMMSVANQMHRFMNRTTYFKKGDKHGLSRSN